MTNLWQIYDKSMANYGKFIANYVKFMANYATTRVRVCVGIRLPRCVSPKGGVGAPLEFLRG